MQILPLKPVPSQVFSSIFNNQQTTIDLYMLGDGNLYMDVDLNNTPLVTGVLLCNNVKVVRNLYLGFLGDFLIADTQGSSDPTYDGLGTRYQLVYLEVAEANND